MALKVDGSEPRRALDLIAEQLGILASVGDYSRELKMLLMDSCEVTMPIRSFLLDLRGAAAADPLSAAELKGYRYLILPEERSKQEDWVFAEVDADSEGRESSAEIWREAAAGVVNEVLVSPKVQNLAAEQDFEVAWLTIQSLAISCLWLRDVNGRQSDRIIRFERKDGGEVAWEIEERDAFVMEIRRRAQERLASGILI